MEKADSSSPGHLPCLPGDRPSGIQGPNAWPVAQAVCWLWTWGAVIRGALTDEAWQVGLHARPQASLCRYPSPGPAGLTGTFRGH